jgi:hypothetical protein
MNAINEFKRYNSFGWDIFKKYLPTGEEYQTTVDTQITFADVGITTLWVKGLITGLNVTTGVVTPPRVAGSFTDPSRVIPVGVYEYLVEEATEWWCLPTYANGGESPALTSVVIKAGDSRTFDVGTLLFMVSGSFSIDGITYGDEPLPIELQNSSLTISAVTDSYGLLFDRKK